MIALGLLFAGVPEHVAGKDAEGPSVLMLRDAHGVDATNVVALTLLILGTLGLLWGAVQHPSALIAATSKHPFASILLTAQLAMGVVLLLLSGVSTAALLWASGTFLSVTALLGLSALLRQGIP